MNSPDDPALDETTESSPAGSEANRPDPVFKAITREVARQLGLLEVKTEQQYSTLADLVLAVPSGLSLEGTLFDFFRTINVLEFKSEGDHLYLRDYVRNRIRTDIEYIQRPDLTYDDLLNVIVTSRYPNSFLAAAQQAGVVFRPEPDQPWLWRGQDGFQSVVIIVCRDLPIEEKYYDWLAFAPSDSRKWRDYVLTIFRQSNRAMLRVVNQLRPRELKMLSSSTDIIALLREQGELTPQDEERLLKDQAELAAFIFDDLSNKRPDLAEQILEGFSPEKRLAGLEPDDLLAGLSEEKQQVLLDALLAKQNKAKTRKSASKRPGSDEEK